MEMIIGCIFLTILLLILAIFCRNVTFTIKIEQNLDTYTELKDPFDSEGNPVDKEEKSTFDELMKTVHSVMLDMEEDNNE